MVASSGLAPKGMETPQAILIAVQMGAELGMPPMASLQNVAVINGRPSVWGDAMLGVCRSSGMFDEREFEEFLEGTADDAVAVCRVRRVGGKVIERRFSLREAKVAGLAGKAGPWKTYPNRMLALRARAFALRDGFADVLRGFAIAEEVYNLSRKKATETTVASETGPLAALTASMTADEAAIEEEFQSGDLFDKGSPTPD